MAVHTPEKILVGKIKIGSISISEFYSGGPYDGAPVSYQVTFDINSISAGYPNYANNSNLYNANDIQVGWQFLLPQARRRTLRATQRSQKISLRSSIRTMTASS